MQSKQGERLAWNGNNTWLSADLAEEWEQIFSRAWCDRTRGNGFKQTQVKCKLAIRMKLFTTQVLKNWKRLVREVVDAHAQKHSRSR